MNTKDMEDIIASQIAWDEKDASCKILSLIIRQAAGQGQKAVLLSRRTNICWRLVKPAAYSWAHYDVEHGRP